MDIADDIARKAETRPDFHNLAIEETVAKQGACARIHVPTGRICTLPHKHSGSCSFVPPEEVQGSLQQHQAGGAR
jgi:hypothetical protein